MDDTERDVKAEIVEGYLNFVKNNKRLPIYNDLPSSRATIRHYFGNISNLHQHVTETVDLTKYIGIQSNLFERADKIYKKLAEQTSSQRYFVTTAVADSEVDMNFLSSIRTYAKENDAAICILPCESITNSFENETAIFDKVFHDEDMILISDNIQLNENLYFASIQVSAKQIKPTTGLARVGSQDASYIFAAPKQFLEYIPSGNSRGKVQALFTPGSCTKPSYFNNTYVSKRLSYIAEQDHTMGGVIIEIIDEKVFHFRHVQANEKGEFVDKGVRYTPKKVKRDSEVSSATLEMHTGYTDLDLLDKFITNMDKLNVVDVYLHDVFDGYSINHHIEGKTFEKARRDNEGIGLREELINCGNMINHIAQYTKGIVYIVKANHDEFLDRYFESGRYAFDARNLKTAFETGIYMFEEGDLLQAAIQKYVPLRDNVVFLSRSDTQRIGEREMAAHGDLGQNGGPVGLNSLEKVYGSCMVGHAHTPAIQRNVFRMGTMTKLDMGYNRGPSTWVNGFGLVYSDGTAQIINFVNGEFE